MRLPGVKEEHYTVKPLLEGQMNMGYYELLAGVYNPAGEQVGFCFAELLPGARNKRFPIKTNMRSGSISVTLKGNGHEHDRL